MGKSKMTWIIIGLVLLAVLIVVVGCAGQSRGEAGVDIPVDEVYKLWQSKEIVIIDVRTPGEYQEGHIPGVANIPLDQLEKRIGEIPRDKKVVLICRTGNRSASGTKLLRDKGLTNVFNSKDGMTSWKGPVEK
jgi:rhodanese-related sulfurtransferase